MKEKRIFHRLLVDTDIEHRLIDNDNISIGKTRDISEGGICITTEGEPLAKEGNYRLAFTLPGKEEKLEVNGKVVWAKRYCAGSTELFDNGIIFIDPSDQFIDVINDFSIGAVAEE
jgi:Tfp pilus assembly protein PilZ